MPGRWTLSGWKIQIVQHRVLFFQFAFWHSQIEKIETVYLINSYANYSDTSNLTLLWKLVVLLNTKVNKLKLNRRNSRVCINKMKTNNKRLVASVQFFFYVYALLWCILFYFIQRMFSDLSIKVNIQFKHSNFIERG